MNCYFCNINLLADPGYNCYLCANCNAAHYGSHLNLRLKGINHYRFPYYQIILPNLNSKYLHKIYPQDEPDAIARILDGKGNIVVQWDHVPNINPTNIDDKLKLFILFS